MTITEYDSRGSVWSAGELIASWDAPGEYSVLLCIEPRTFGPRGGLRRPARMATVTGQSWRSVCDQVASLGFTRPTLTATQVRNGRAA